MGHAAQILPEFEAPAPPLADELVNDPAIERILGSVRGHLGVEIAFVARYIEGEQRELTHVSTDLDLPMGPGYRNPRDEGYCWHILNGRLPELIQDAADHPLTETMEITHFLPVGCHINTPLRLSDGTVWGSFCALGRNPDRTMNERDLDILKSFASLAAERIESSLEHDVLTYEARKRVESMLDGHGVSTFQQPIVSLGSGDPVGVECLSRFPDLTKRGPEAWFEDAELVGLGKELEMTAVRCALDTLGHIPDGLYATINVSPQTVATGALRELLESVEPGNIVVEITEHCQVDDFDELAREIAALKAHAKIAIDDVGTGYAGLRHIVDLQPDILKMDMVLTRGIEADPARKAMTAALVQLAHEIGCTLVAEGIETEHEARVMRKLGVDCGQGYLFSRPLPVVAAQQYLMEHAAKG
ncbi:sensor domain-containing phosphodiesterase [Aurantiacibacter aquimixticola]|uniref:EAL domain-containing protein n=1 Tax=Aurantiacibacter aquimixticola TaxID=1958945 RepID=A0A419RTW8_9SPHN|nr:EAL domain-containing protein [Aurantiacibacter aquimixticola]RJY09232.1 EAL domain-containing protein [Aurantiacibacter aquimixticola]